MDPDSTIPALHFANDLAYNASNVIEPINLYINNEGPLWPEVPDEQYHSTGSAFHQEPGWSLYSHGAAVAFTPHGSVQVTPSHQYYAMPASTDNMYQHLTALPEHDMVALPQHNISETIAQPGTDHTRTRATRKRRIENHYQCLTPGCDAKYHTQGDLTKHHFRKHTPEAEWPYACDICEKRFYDKRDHGRHMQVERKRARLSVGEQLNNTEVTPSHSSPMAGIVSTSETSKPKPTALRKVSNPGDHAADVENKLATLDFYRATHEHDTAKEALAAVTSEVSRFIKLRAAQIKIEAFVPSSHELITFTALHRIKGVAACPLSRSTSTRTNSVPPEDSRQGHLSVAEDMEMKVDDSQIDTLTPKADSARPRIATSPRQSNTRPRPSYLSPPRYTHPDTIPTQLAHISASPSKGPNVQVQAIRLTIRQRPGYQRSVTHPGHITLNQQSTTADEIDSRLNKKQQPQEPHRKRLDHKISFSGLRLHMIDRQIRSSRGLAWAKSTSKLFPGKAQEL